MVSFRFKVPAMSFSVLLKRIQDSHSSEFLALEEELLTNNKPEPDPLKTSVKLIRFLRQKLKRLHFVVCHFHNVKFLINI